MADLQDSAILAPFLALMLLTLVVWIVMYVRRIGYMLRNRIDAQELTTPEKGALLLPDEVNYPAHNLRNLFELPVLFYALCLYLYVTGLADAVYVMTAWVFVVLRAAHSFVHCTTNHVLTRFWLYLLASVGLWFMLIRAAIGTFF